MSALTNKQFYIAGAVVLVGAYLLYRGAKAVPGAVADGVAGIATGNNALTEGTPYQGWGIIGTLGAAFNGLSGGAFQRSGEWLTGRTFELLNGGESIQKENSADGKKLYLLNEGIGE